MKKIFALVLAMMMVVGMMSAFAADPTGSITVKPSTTVSLTGKTLKAYKIMDATYQDDAVAYTIPAGMVSFFNTYFTAASKDAKTLASEAGKTLDDYVTNIMKDWGDDSDTIKNFEYAALAAAKTANPAVVNKTGVADGDNVKFSALEPGYYVIEDEGIATPISVLMLDTVTDANVEITLKAEDKSEKKLKTTAELINEKADELGLGRAVNYIITNEIPDTTGFEYMYYMINDTLSTGLTFNPESVVVKVTRAGKDAVGTDGQADYVPAVPALNKTLELNKDYYLYYGESDTSVLNGKTFIIALEDVVKEGWGGATVTVDYTATVNSNAVVGVNPNTNKANVEYSNNPDKDQRQDKENYKGIPANKDNHPTGVGPDKWVDTYTTKITILKVDGTTNNPLPGVEFTLTGTSKDVVAKAEEVFEIDPTGDYWLLNNGTYTTNAPQTAVNLEATTGPAGWVKMGTNETVANDVPVRVVNGEKYRPYVKETDGTTVHYVIVEANNADYASVTTKYKKVVKSADADATDSYDVARTGLTATTTGALSFAQLGAGSYTITETGILDGYNGIAPITFDVAVELPEATSVKTGEEKAKWTVSNVKFAGKETSDAIVYDETNGTFKITITNNKGTELPSTGGIGTTLFYIGGGILVVLAVVMLVTKRRMSSND